MKIELDLNNKEELLAQKRELTAALAVIDFALASLDPGQPIIRVAPAAARIQQPVQSQPAEVHAPNGASYAEPLLVESESVKLQEPKKRGRKPGRKPWADSMPGPARVSVRPDPTFPFPPRIDGFSREATRSEEFDVPPMHKKAVEVGKTLINPWSLTDLMARINGDTKRAQMWVVSWLEIEWVEPVGYNIYRLTDKFGT
jgi:hypothetical protein